MVRLNDVSGSEVCCGEDQHVLVPRPACCCPVSFKNMRKDPKANYKFLPADLLKKGQFMCKGVQS
ncbi:amine sulfotransferase-like [Clarias magur]|uniref:Amine sulfotransferase-like n=1 Tax=Clarias magur TaxID=1594786 RepID=A0A8J4WZW7_CLAMG|nr:amine sulfotransferase-like [Clarias magur]